MAEWKTRFVADCMGDAYCENGIVSETESEAGLGDRDKRRCPEGARTESIL